MIQLERDVGDIIDRWSIAKLKAERIGSEENKKEFEAFNIAIKEVKTCYPILNWERFKGMLVSANSYIWDLESDIRKAMLDNDLMEVGRRAILIRKFNSLRVEIKNVINELTHEGFIDVKKDHISEH